MTRTTLCFLLKNDQVLLGMKKRGFGAGKWNGVGGKVEEDEMVEHAAMREVEEEIGVKIAPENLARFGEIEFEFKDNPAWRQHCTVFTVEKWSGDPSESDEMRPVWYFFDEVPFEHMWIDDPYWIPQVLAGKKIKARFLFDQKGNKLVEHEVRDGLR